MAENVTNEIPISMNAVSQKKVSVSQFDNESYVLLIK